MTVAPLVLPRKIGTLSDGFVDKSFSYSHRQFCSNPLAVIRRHTSLIGRMSVYVSYKYFIVYYDIYIYIYTMIKFVVPLCKLTTSNASIRTLNKMKGDQRFTNKTESWSWTRKSLLTRAVTTGASPGPRPADSERPLGPRPRGKEDTKSLENNAGSGSRARPGQGVTNFAPQFSYGLTGRFQFLVWSRTKITPF